MPHKASVIEINGKLYDAETGNLVSAANEPATPAPQKETKAQSQSTRRGSIDGFAAPVGQAGAKRAPRKSRAAVEVHTKTQKTHTLHRAAAAHLQQFVKKPQESASSLKPILTRRRLHAATTSARNQRAANASRSQAIAKFGGGTIAETTTTPAPAVESAAPPMPVLARHPATKHHAPSHLEQAAHVAPERELKVAPKRHRRKTKPALASLAAALVLGGYVTYLNIPRMAMRVAAARAGFNASLPSYQPAGFRFDGPIAYSKGQITISFSSTSDDRAFRITQRQSDWDSQSLLDNHVAREHQRYLTFQERGLTVYVYDGSQATWVDGGVWYTVEGESLLNSEQILKLAASL